MIWNREHEGPESARGTQAGALVSPGTQEMTFLSPAIQLPELEPNTNQASGRKDQSLYWVQKAPNVSNPYF